MSIIYILSLFLAGIFLGAVMWYVYTKIREGSKPPLGWAKSSVLVGALILLITFFGGLFSFIIGIDVEILFLMGMIIFQAIIANTLLIAMLILDWIVARFHLKHQTQGKPRRKYILDWKYYLVIGIILIAIGVGTKEYLLESIQVSHGPNILILIWTAIIGIGLLIVWLSLVSIRPEQSR